MRHTVIAVFDKPEDARQAIEAVKLRGFDASAVHRRQDDGPADAEVIPPAAEIESGPLTGLLDRLSSLFGVDAPHLAHYQEAVRRGGSIVQVDDADETQAAAARDTLLDAGAVNIDDRVAEWARTGWRGPVAGAAAASTPAAEGAGIIVHRHEVSIGGVRVYGHAAVLAFDELADDFRADYEAQYAAQGTSYDEFDPAYRYGHALASDTRYDGRSWGEMEPEARAEWQLLHPQSGWERFKSAVRYAWEHATRH